MYKIYTSNTDITDYCNNIAWSNDANTLGIQLTFDSIKKIAPNSIVSLYNGDTEIFRTVAFKPIQKRWTYSYTCQDYSYYLKSKKIKQFNGESASDAINSLCSEAYITGDIVEIPTKITKIYKDELSNIIDDILKQANEDQGIEYSKEIEVTTLYIRKINEMKITPNVIYPKTIDITRTTENMRNKVVVTSSDEKTVSVYATAQDSTKFNFYGEMDEIITVDDKNVAQAQNIADNKLTELNTINCSTSLDLIALSGGDEIKANRMIYLKVGSILDGYYKITSANHTLTKGMHKVTINIEWSESP